MAKIPEKFVGKPELVAQVIEARKVQMETEDTAFAIEWLMESSEMSLTSAQKVLEDITFQYVALYPEGHPGLEAIRAEQRVKGRDATVDHKDPEGPATLENLHLLCRGCNTLKSNRTWSEFQEASKEWEARVKERQDNRPDFVCKQTGLSVRGRSWKEAGCLTPQMCLREEECDNGQYNKWAAEMDATIVAMENAYWDESDNPLDAEAEVESMQDG